MGKKLLTCEKPDAATTIGEILGVPTNTKAQGYYENNEYIITWAYGHMLKWKEPDEINENWKVWRLEDLPLKFDHNKDLTVDQEKRKQVSIISKLLNRSDVDIVINAGDADREGILIQEELYAHSNCKKPIKVLWSQSLTDKEIIKCMNNLKNREDFVPLLDAAIARATIDNMFGKTDTRGLALTIFKGEHISYGRCQTPLLKFLADREVEIQNFKVKDYYEIVANFDDKYEGTLYDTTKKESIKYESKEEAENVKNAINGVGKVLEYNKTKKSESSNKLYSLSDLQKDMGKKYHFTADKTLKIAQSLYEKKLTSYPRTDTEYINNEVLDEIDDRIKSATKAINIENIELNKENLKAVCKPQKVTGHHALLPTEKICTKEMYEKLTEDEKLVYYAICKKLLAIMMPPYEYYSIDITTDVNGKIFKSSGTKTINLGWKELYKNDKFKKDDDEVESDNNKELPELNIGDTNNVASVKINAKKTKAPDRYTTSTIISLMEKWKIGRPATQAGIIQRLIDMEFITLTKNKYSATKKGIEFVSHVLDELKAPDLTKNVEEKLQKIADGEYTKEALIKDVYDNQLKRLDIYKNMAKEIGTTNVLSKTNYNCPICGKNLESQKYSYNCSCGFKLNKEICKKKLSEKNLQELFTIGITSLIKGFTGKKGSFNAKLVIDKENKGVKFEFK